MRSPKLASMPRIVVYPDPAALHCKCNQLFYIRGSHFSAKSKQLLACGVFFDSQRFGCLPLVAAVGYQFEYFPLAFSGSNFFFLIFVLFLVLLFGVE